MGVCPRSMTDAAFNTRATASCSADSGYSLFVISAVPTPEQIPKICASANCQRVIAAIKSAQPTECNTGGPAWNFMIYGQILNPIAAGCGGGGPASAPAPALAPMYPVPAPAPASAYPAPTPSPPPPTLPTLPAPTAPPSTAPPLTTAPPVVTTPAPPATTSVPTPEPSTGPARDSAAPPPADTNNSTAMPGSISVYLNRTEVPSSAINSTKTIDSGENSNMNATFIIVAGALVLVTIIAFIAFRAGKRRGSNNPMESHRSLSPSAYASVQSSYKNRNVVIDRHARRARYVPAPSPYIPLPYIPASPVMGSCSSPDARSTALTAPSSNTTAATGIFSQRTILEARIPLDEIVMGDVISQGAFGEVLDGYYKGEAVAVKRLLPSLRDNMNEMESFLDEAKMLMTLRHTRVVQFIGVAWNAPTDLCIVTELMDGGDLQTMLTRADANYEPTGFDVNKVKIALHIIHALTYLHGLTPPIVHRDLKSTNVLLTKNFDAKLTDFGISRERGDSTMTSNVGSWLWMAPEVMLGKQYDEKADIFSFGVVLSELDTQKIPYSHAREPGTGRKLPEMVMLNMVSVGRLTVAFSDGADADMVAIGRACVTLDPKRRPTAREVLRRIDKIYRRHL